MLMSDGDLIVSLQQKLQEKERELASLWMLLDDIESSGNIYKPDNTEYFKYVTRIVGKRHSVTNASRIDELCNQVRREEKHKYESEIIDLRHLLKKVMDSENLPDDLRQLIYRFLYKFNQVKSFDDVLDELSKKEK